LSETRPERGGLQPRRGGPAMRLRGLIRKEFLQVLRDPSSIAIAFLMPVALLLLFGYGVSLDALHVPVAVVSESDTPEAASFIGSFRHSRYFNPAVMRTMAEAETALRERRAEAIVRLRPDFARGLRGNGPAPIQLIVNGTDANTGRIITGYVEGAWLTWLARTAAENAAAPPPGVDVEYRIWFNPEVRSRNYLVPGLVAVIMTLIGAMLTAMVMAREWERGTMEGVLATPVTVRELMLGKLVPYFLLGMGGMAVSVTVAVWLFQVPLRASLWVLVAASALFMLDALGMGLLISAVARSQFVAAQAALMGTFLPAFILSGFIFDIDSMPRVVRFITYGIAARYFVATLQTVFLAGNVWPVIVPNCAAMAAMAAVFLGLTRLLSRKSLE
jgi:ABC-2 type transport system permease protein